MEMQTMSAPLNLDRPFWNVFCDGEIKAFTSREAVAEEVEQCIIHYGKPVVFELNVEEGSSRIVTDEFLPEPDEEADEEREFAEYRAQRAWEREMRPVVL